MIRVDYPHVAQFCLSALKCLYPVLTAADQHHLYTTASRSLATSRRRGDKRIVDYWSEQPIVSLAVTPYVCAELRPTICSTERVIACLSFGCHWKSQCPRSRYEHPTPLCQEPSIRSSIILEERSLPRSIYTNSSIGTFLTTSLGSNNSSSEREHRSRCNPQQPVCLRP